MSYEEYYDDYYGGNVAYAGYSYQDPDSFPYAYDYPEEYQGAEEYYEPYEYPDEEYFLPSYDSYDDEYAGYGGKEGSPGYDFGGESAEKHYDYEQDFADQGFSSFTDDEFGNEAEDSYSRTVWSDIFQGGLVLLIFVLALLPPLVYFLAGLIKIKEGHISWLYMTTVTLVVVRLLFFCTLGPDGPQVMLGLSLMCACFAAFSAGVLYNKGTPRIDDFIVSAFASTGESNWQRWLKFYSIVLVYVGLCPLLWFVLVLDMSRECHGGEGDCYGHNTDVGAAILIAYAMVGAVCNAFEALRKNASVGAEAGQEGRGDVELDGTARGATDDDLERLSLI